MRRRWGGQPTLRAAVAPLEVWGKQGVGTLQGADAAQRVQEARQAAAVMRPELEERQQELARQGTVELDTTRRPRAPPRTSESQLPESRAPTAASIRKLRPLTVREEKEVTDAAFQERQVRAEATWGRSTRAKQSRTRETPLLPTHERSGERRVDARREQREERRAARALEELEGSARDPEGRRRTTMPGSSLTAEEVEAQDAVPTSFGRDARKAGTKDAAAAKSRLGAPIEIFEVEKEDATGDLHGRRTHVTDYLLRRVADADARDTRREEAAAAEAHDAAATLSQHAEADETLQSGRVEAQRQAVRGVRRLVAGTDGGNMSGASLPWQEGEGGDKEDGGDCDDCDDMLASFLGGGLREGTRALARRAPQQRQQQRLQPHGGGEGGGDPFDDFGDGGRGTLELELDPDGEGRLLARVRAERAAERQRATGGGTQQAHAGDARYIDDAADVDVPQEALEESAEAANMARAQRRDAYSADRGSDRQGGRGLAPRHGGGNDDGSPDLGVAWREMQDMQDQAAAATDRRVRHVASKPRHHVPRGDAIDGKEGSESEAGAGADGEGEGWEDLFVEPVRSLGQSRHGGVGTRKGARRSGSRALHPVPSPLFGGVGGAEENAEGDGVERDEDGEVARPFRDTRRWGSGDTVTSASTSTFDVVRSSGFSYNSAARSGRSGASASDTLGSWDRMGRSSGSAGSTGPVGKRESSRTVNRGGIAMQSRAVRRRAAAMLSEAARDGDGRLSDGNPDDLAGAGEDGVPPRPPRVNPARAPVAYAWSNKRRGTPDDADVDAKEDSRVAQHVLQLAEEAVDATVRATAGAGAGAGARQAPPRRRAPQLFAGFGSDGDPEGGDAGTAAMEQARLLQEQGVAPPSRRRDATLASQVQQQALRSSRAAVETAAVPRSEEAPERGIAPNAQDAGAARRRAITSSSSGRRGASSWVRRADEGVTGGEVDVFEAADAREEAHDAAGLSSQVVAPRRGGSRLARSARQDRLGTFMEGVPEEGASRPGTPGTTVGGTAGGGDVDVSITTAARTLTPQRRRAAGRRRRDARS